MNVVAHGQEAAAAKDGGAPGGAKVRGDHLTGNARKVEPVAIDLAARAPGAADDPAVGRVAGGRISETVGDGRLNGASPLRHLRRFQSVLCRTKKVLNRSPVKSA